MTDVGEFVVCKTFRSVHEYIKSTLGFYGIESCVDDVGIEHVAALLVVGYVNLCIERLLDDPLPDSRSVNRSQSSVGDRDGSRKVVIVFVLR